MARVRVIATDEKAMRDLFHSTGWRKTLDTIGFAVVGHAIPHVGVDTGALVNSLGHAIDDSDDKQTLVAVMGSGTRDGVDPIYYAAPHLAGRKDPDGKQAPANRRSRPKRPHPTKKAPTLPFSKAMDELGIDYEVEEFKS